MHLTEDVHGGPIQVAQDDHVDIEGGIMGHVRIYTGIKAMRFITRKIRGLTDKINPESIDAACPSRCALSGL